jgi:hypothetical protein
MAVLGNSVVTLVDVAKRLDPDGKIARIAELLNQTNDVLDDITWMEGNLPTGNRTTIRAGLPGVAFRALNEGVPRSKSDVSQFDEGAAMLEGFSEVDRKEAILSGDVAGFRLSEAQSFMEAMNQAFTTCLIYGNASATPKQFNGLATRYNAISANSTTTGQQIIDCGGTGTDNYSIYLVVWDPQKITGIYPKGTKAGLFHEDASDVTGGQRRLPARHGSLRRERQPLHGLPRPLRVELRFVPQGLPLRGPRGEHRPFGPHQHDRDRRRPAGHLHPACRACAEPNGKAAFYAPRVVTSMLRRQLVNKKNGFLSWDEIGGRKVLNFDGIPIRRVDAMNVNEARVV